MIFDISEMKHGETARGDVCVVGTGPAGAEAIDYLRRHGLDAVVAEGGRMDFDKTTQELTRSQSTGHTVREPDPNDKLTPYLAPEFRGEGRLRQFGGNSNIWTGKWREFEALDFKARAHVPDSGWPLTFEELLPLYREIEKEYDFGDFATAEERLGYGPFLERIRGTGIKTTYHYWEAAPLRVPERFGRKFRDDPQLRIVTGAHAVELVQDEANDSVSRLRCRSLEGREIFFEAKHFILAMGGIETPRLLLASDGKYAEGVGNANGLVGRYFMDHPKLKSGLFWPGPALDLLPDGLANFPRPRFKPCFSLADEIQEEHGLLNHTIQFAPLSGGIGSRARKLASVGNYAAAAGQLADFIRKPGKPRPLRIGLIMEQAPNRDSTITLSNTRDALGMRMTKIHWHLNELDYSSFRKTIDLLSDKLCESGLGRLDFGKHPPSLDDTVDCRHHIGTTRMAGSETHGVVDGDCRVFSSPNLFVAGSAVFPTGHSYGPTLTIVALARRACQAILRDHGVVAAPARSA